MDEPTRRTLNLNACSMFKHETHHLGKTPIEAAIFVCGAIGLIPSTFAGTIHDAETLHQEAMDSCDRANFANRHLDARIAAPIVKHHMIRALAFERAAADVCPLELEPSRSILYSSAAFCAIDAEEYDEANRLIECALKGTPNAHTFMRLGEAQDTLLQIARENGETK